MRSRAGFDARACALVSNRAVPRLLVRTFTHAVLVELLRAFRVGDVHDSDLLNHDALSSSYS
jgi:hypothetical protein